MDSLYAISVFVRVAQAKSFTAAAKRLGISPSGVSRSVTRLEEQLGVRLVNRTTRNVSLTDDGSTFFERCRQILNDLEDAESLLTRRQTKPRGRLRVLVPVDFGRIVLVPILAKFAQHYEDVTIDAEFSNRGVDLAEEGIDVVVWIGEVRDRPLVTRKLSDIRQVTVAAPTYLSRFGEPKTPDDLPQHHCLGYHIPHTNRYRDWNFASGGRQITTPASGNLNINNGAALLDAAIHGAGIATVAMFVAAEAIRTGDVRIVLKDYVPSGAPVWIGYLQRRHLSSRIRIFVDFLTSNVPACSTWDTIFEG